jgi:formate hydrogenlyase subunit 3/multisubunit Na+/H+ antiporter MnhD subunit
MGSGWPWSVAAIAIPLAGAALAFVWARRAQTIGVLAGITTAGVGVALIAQLLARGVQRYSIGGWGVPLGIDLYLDGLSALLLAITAITGLGVTLYGRHYFADAATKARFWPLWLFLWAGLNALFLSGDIFNLYVTLELVGLAAVALVALAGGGAAFTGALRYLLVGLVGSASYLLGVALLYGQYATLDILALGPLVGSSTVTWVAMAAMFAGLTLKTALFPLHFWLPGAHGAAPAPVSAVLSGLVVKAAFYLLMRLWLQVFPIDLPGPGQLLGILGTLAILWGSLQALRQERLKMLLAYSTVAQLGYLFLVFPLATTTAADTAWLGGLMFIASHALAKSALFLSAGNILYHKGHDRVSELDEVARHEPFTLFAFALAGVSLIGLPPSGGFSAKWLLMQAAIESGQWWWVLVMVAGAFFAAAYVFRVLGHAFTPGRGEPLPRAVAPSMTAATLVLALGAISLGLLAVPVDALRLIGWPLAAVAAG